MELMAVEIKAGRELQVAQAVAHETSLDELKEMIRGMGGPPLSP